MKTSTAESDPINRQDVINVISNLAQGGIQSPEVIYIDDVIDSINRLPRFERKRGTWMYETYVNKYTGQPQREYFCSNCHTSLHKRPTSKFCPFCGCVMNPKPVEVC